jgi:hypothetical protein
MDRAQNLEDEQEENYKDTIVDCVVLPLVRGISFGIGQLIAFSILGPKIFKK